MKAPSNSAELASEYTSLWRGMVVRPEWRDAVIKTVRQIAENEARYQTVSDRLGGEIPWEWIGAIHAMECGGDFSKHLHNGDSLRWRTRNEPAGRPPLPAVPPFVWEESAIDALRLKGLQKVSVWTITEMLFQAERYNGFGYRIYHPEVLSPYLWSGSTAYSKGKYVADGKWSANTVSKQLGVAPILGAFFSMKEGK